MTPEDFLVALLGTGPLPAVPSSPEERERLVELVELHGLEGLAVARDREGGGVLPGELRSRWEPAYRVRGLAAALVLESAERARGALDARSIPSLLFKGAALVADGSYPDPGARRMDDADLLVGPGDAVVAVETLRGAGFEPVTGWDPDRMGWVDAVTLVDREAPPGSEPVLDLHWRTAYDRIRFGGRDAGEGEGSLLWEDADVEAGLPAPGPHLVVVAEHLLKHLRFKVHLPAWGDLVRLAARVEAPGSGGGGGWDAVEAAVAGSRLERGLRSLLEALARDAEAPIPEHLRRRASAALTRKLSPRALAGTLRPAGHRLSGLLLRWRLVGSVKGVLADLGEAAFPPPAWLRARYGSGGARAWARYVSDVLRWAAYRGRSPASPNQELFHPRARE